MQLMLTIATIIYLGAVKPFDDILLNNLEMFNEAVNMLVLDSLFLFTNEYNNRVKNYGGRLFIFLLFLNIGV